MPLPRERRPIIERGLAVFNGLAAVALVLYGAAAVTATPARASTNSTLVLAPLPLLALIGLLARRPSWLRLCLTLPSGPLWVLLGLVLMFVGLENCLSFPLTPVYFALPLATAPLVLAAGILTIKVGFVWLRRL
jgi:hypothetical protein